MTATVEKYRAKIARRAIVMEIGGFRAPTDPTSSWFGRASFALPDEEWPCMDEKPMHALCQINLTTLPFRPPRLDDLEFITVFVGPDELPTGDEVANGCHWCLRAYPSIAELVPLAKLKTDSRIKPFPMRPKVIEEDFPCWEDVPAFPPKEIDDQYHDLFQNVSGFKLGGWPSLVQSSIYYSEPGESKPMNAEYVFQIDTTEKGNWMWADNGVGFFGRGTRRGKKDQWALDWQCY